MKTLMKEDPTSSKRSKKKGKSKATTPDDPVPTPPTPSKKNKKVWRKNKTSSTATTSPGTDEMTSTRSGMEKGPALWTLNQELALGRFPPLSQLYPLFAF